jgi:hypothetical protein
VKSKKLAAFLLVGSVVAVSVLVASVMLFVPSGFCCTSDDLVYQRCEQGVNARCAINDSFNINAISYCDDSYSPSSLQELHRVDEVNESTGVVTCNPPR